MDREWIDNVVCEIMFHDGPDRHIDGHDLITDFIEAIINGEGSDWAEAYAAKYAGKTRYL